MNHTTVVVDRVLIASYLSVLDEELSHDNADIWFVIHMCPDITVCD